MAEKTPFEERQIILARDHRRKYGARVAFQVRSALNLGEIGEVAFSLRGGCIATLRSSPTSEPGYATYEVEAIRYRVAGEAEATGMRIAQSVLLAAISMNVGVRLSDSSHEPVTVFDRTISKGATSNATAVLGWSSAIVAQELADAFQHEVRDRKLVLSMELFASARLEANDRTRFVTAVSALEPLAEQADLGAEVRAFVDRAIADLEKDIGIPPALKKTLAGRLLNLRSESIRQSLFRLCDAWFPGDMAAKKVIDQAYSLRSKILHEGRADPDILLGEELQKVSSYMRQIYAREFDIKLRAAAA